MRKCEVAVMEEMSSEPLNDVFAPTVARLNECDGYAVLVVDSASNERDAYGPMSAMDALVEADRIDRDITSEGMEGITVDLIRIHL